MTVPTNETLLVVDGHSLAFRAFFALPVDNFSTSSGQATNAVWGFATMLAQVIDAEKPDHLGVAFDVKGGTFRNEMLPQYKGTREAAPEELLTQLPLIQRMLGKELTLPQQVWSRLNLAWALFFILCGLANIYIAFWLPQNIWVNFKVFGLTALTLIFTLLSGVYIYRHMPQDDKH